MNPFSLGENGLFAPSWHKPPKLKRYDGQTALHFAAKSGSAECIKLLLDRGADVNALAYEKDTPLYYAELYKHKAAIEALRQAMEKPSKK